MLRNVLLFLVVGNLSMSCMASQREAEGVPLLAGVPRVKGFTKQQWMEMNPQDEKNQDLMDEAAEYYREKYAELEKLIDSFKPCCLFACCCWPKVPGALLEIERRVWERRLFSSCCVSPQTYVAIREREEPFQKKREVSPDDKAFHQVEKGKGLEIEDLQKTLPDQSARFELFKTQMDQKVEVLTQTMTEQQEEIQRLREELESLKSQQQIVPSENQSFVGINQVEEVIEKVMGAKGITEMQRNLEEVTKLAKTMNEGPAAEKKANFKYVLKFAYLVKALVDAKERELAGETTFTKETWAQLVAQVKAQFESTFGVTLK